LYEVARSIAAAGNSVKRAAGRGRRAVSAGRRPCYGVADGDEEAAKGKG
jgi:hypothetical protein